MSIAKRARMLRDATKSLLRWLRRSKATGRPLFEFALLGLLYLFPSFVSRNASLCLLIQKAKFFDFISGDAILSMLRRQVCVEVLEVNAATIRQRRLGELDASADEPMLNSLIKDGFCRLGVCKGTVGSESSFIENCLSSIAGNAQVQMQASRFDFPNDSANYWSIPFQSWQRPYFLEILKTISETELLSRYFKDDFFIYSINTMVSYPSASKCSVTKIHRDHDDVDFLTVFVYWTRTTRSNGAPSYLTKSHLQHSGSADANTYEEIHTDRLIYLEAEVGELIAMDTFGLHAGSNILAAPRIVSWIRFGPQVTFASFADGELANAKLYDAMKKDCFNKWDV